MDNINLHLLGQHGVMIKDPSFACIIVPRNPTFLECKRWALQDKLDKANDRFKMLLYFTVIPLFVVLMFALLISIFIPLISSFCGGLAPLFGIAYGMLIILGCQYIHSWIYFSNYIVKKYYHKRKYKYNGYGKR